MTKVHTLADNEMDNFNTEDTLAKRFIKRAISLKTKKIETLSDDVKMINIAVLSYVWGQSNEEINPFCPKRVTLSGKNHNWHGILDEVNKYRDTHNVDFLWIDALCINQLDTKDLVWHIPHMRTVYKQCGLCFIKINSMPITTIEDFAEKLKKGLYNINQNQLHFSALPLECTNKQLVEHIKEKYQHGVTTSYRVHLNNVDADNTIFRHLIQISEDSWFDRIWTLQEGILPAADRIVWMASEGTNDQIHMLLMVFVHILDFGLENASYSQEFRIALSKIVRLIGITTRKHIRHKGLTFGDAYDYGRLRNTSVPEDRVVATLGLTTLSNTLTLPPNYATLGLQRCFELIEDIALANGDISTILFYGNTSSNRSYSPDVTDTSVKWNVYYLEYESWNACLEGLDSSHAIVRNSVCYDVTNATQYIIPPVLDTSADNVCMRGLKLIDLVGKHCNWDIQHIINTLPIEFEDVNVSCSTMLNIIFILRNTQHNNWIHFINFVEHAKTLVGCITGKRTVNMYTNNVTLMTINNIKGYGLLHDITVKLELLKAMCIKTRLINSIYRSEWILCKLENHFFRKVGIAYTGSTKCDIVHNIKENTESYGIC